MAEIAKTIAPDLATELVLHMLDKISWQPMETCPAEPWERYLLADSDLDVGVGYIADDGEWYIALDSGESASEPLYWMPIPKHPLIDAPAQSATESTAPTTPV
jgi:hypothetical protein